MTRGDARAGREGICRNLTESAMRCAEDVEFPGARTRLKTLQHRPGGADQEAVLALSMRKSRLSAIDSDAARSRSYSTS